MKLAGIREISDPKYAERIACLERSLICAYLYTGRIAEAISHLELPQYDQAGSENSDSRTQLEMILNHYKDEEHPNISLLHDIHQEWRELVLGASDSQVWIPLVEGDLTGTEKNTISATIQPLEVEVELRRKEADQDLIFFNNHPLDSGDLIFYQALDAVALAKKQLRSKPGRKTPFFRVMFGFPSKEYFYTGESFGLGMSMVVLAQMEKVTIQRTQHRLLKNAVITGGVDINGQIRGISEASLPAKQEAFKNSPFETLVYPQVNKSVIQASEHHSQGKGALPAPGFKAILKDDRVCRRKRISFQSWSRAHLRQSQIFHVLISLVLTLAVGWSLWFFSRDLNPVTISLKDNILSATNSREKILWTHQVFPTEQLKSLESEINEDRVKTIVKDLDKDGLNEIIYSLVSQNEEYGGHLICLSSQGKILWDTDCGAASQFGDEAYPPPYIISKLEPIPGVSQGAQILAVFNHHPWYPSKVMLISKTGTIISTYFHAGHVNHINFIDVSGDGLLDLVFGGTNNETRDAVLGVLELSKVSGHSPQEKDAYTHADSPEAEHLSYLRFPKGSWIDLAKKSRNFSIHDIDITGSEFNVTVRNKAMGYYVIYQFDQKLNYIGAELTDNLVDNYLNFHGTHIYDDYTREYIYESLNKIQTWDGMGWLPYNSISQ
ncbi:MAG: hypothetical protein HQ556_16355 [Candidatus Marinimicrobia bacterium]|nr:hypothetical protein [Candidatus Neomarinimicrobiota bacterium]